MYNKEVLKNLFHITSALVQALSDCFLIDYYGYSEEEIEEMRSVYGDGYYTQALKNITKKY